VWRDDNELLQLLGVVHQGLPQQGDPNVNRHVAEPEQDYARVGQTVAKDEVSKEETSPDGWCRKLIRFRCRFNQCLRVLKARLDVIHCQSRVVGEKLVKIGIVGQILEDHLDRDASVLDHGFASQNIRVLDNAIGVVCVLFCHPDLTSFREPQPSIHLHK
jgi:hypothetical protein